MCIEMLITDPERMPEDNGIGYKIYMKEESGLHNLFHYVETVRKLGKTYQCKSNGLITTYKGTQYPRGIHVYQNFDDAYDYSRYPEVVVKIKYGKVKACGTEPGGPAIVTDKIKLLEEIVL